MQRSRDTRMPSLFQAGTGCKKQTGWGRWRVAGRGMGAAHSCSPGHHTGHVLKSKFLSPHKNINNLKLQQGWCCRNLFPKAPVKGQEVPSWQLCVLICSGSFRAKRKASTLGRDSGDGTPKTDVRGKSGTFQPLKVKGKTRKISLSVL